jgi:hypothetical protein
MRRWQGQVAYPQHAADGRRDTCGAEGGMADGQSGPTHRRCAVCLPPHLEPRPDSGREGSRFAEGCPHSARVPLKTGRWQTAGTTMDSDHRGCHHPGRLEK